MNTKQNSPKKHPAPQPKDLNLKEKEKIFKEQREAKKLRNEKAKATISWLEQKYPSAFCYNDPRPLKIAIEKDIFDKLGEGDPTKTEIRRALDFYVNNVKYHEAIFVGMKRYDLNGHEVEDVEQSHKEYAQLRMDKIKELRNKKSELKRSKKREEPSI